MVKNCPRCGSAMRSMTNGDICSSCGNEIYTTNHTYMDKTIFEATEKNNSSGLYGWICPKCGAVMSPFERCCVNCTQHNFEFTYSTATIPRGSTISDFIDFRKDKLGYR